MLFPIRVLCALMVFACFARAQPDKVELLQKKYEESRRDEDLWNWVEGLAQSAWRYAEENENDKAVENYRRALAQLSEKMRTEEPGFVSLLQKDVNQVILLDISMSPSFAGY